jgi:hypothetical protein
MASFAAVCGETWYVRGFTLGSQMGAGDRNLLYPENICIFCLSERSDKHISEDREARCRTALCVDQRVGTGTGN